MTDPARMQRDETIRKICEMMSARMMSLRAEPTGIELGPDKKGNLDDYSHSQVVRVVLLEEYRSIITPQMLGEANGFQQETRGICDHDIEVATGEAIWWDDLVIFNEARKGVEDWTFTCVVVDPDKFAVIERELSKKPVIEHERRDQDLTQLRQDVEMGI